MKKNRVVTFILSMVINGTILALLWFCEPPMSQPQDQSMEIFLQGNLLVVNESSEDLLAGDLVPFMEFDQEQYQKNDDDNKSRHIEELVYQASTGLATHDDRPVKSELTQDILSFNAVKMAQGDSIDDSPVPFVDDIIHHELSAVEHDMPLAPELESLPEISSSEGKVYQKQEILWQNYQRKALSHPLPPFPDILYREGKETELEFEIKVDKSGRIVDVIILHSSGYPEVDLQVKNRVLSWIFEAKQEDSVDSGKVMVYFRLEKSF